MKYIWSVVGLLVLLCIGTEIHATGWSACGIGQSYCVTTDGTVRAQNYQGTINSGIVPVTQYGAIPNDGIDDAAAITAALASISSGTLYFPVGQYDYATSPNFAKVGVFIVAEKGTVFNHTGTGNAFVIDGGVVGGGIFGLKFQNITVQGNSNSINGVYVRAIHQSIFDNIQVKGASTTGAGIRLDWCVVGEWRSTKVSVNSSTLSPIPLYGILITRRGVGEDSTTQTIIDAAFEGLTQVGGAGIQIDYANKIVIIDGTSESNTNGLVITGNGAGINTVIGLDMESNSVNDLNLNTGGIGGANYNMFFGLLGSGLSTVNNGANRNVFMGGRFASLTLANTTVFNTFYSFNVTSTLTDNSPAGQENEWVNSTAPGGVNKVNKFRGGISGGSSGIGYTSPMAVDASMGNVFIAVATGAGAVTIANPTNGVRGQIITIQVTNISGAGLGALAFDTLYKIGAAWVQPANGFSRSITFFYNGTNWIEINRTAADVVN